MKILLTGGTGYIGGHLFSCLCEKHEVYIVARKSSDIELLKEKATGIVIYEKDTIYDRIKEIQPEMLIHLAGVFYGEHTQDNIENLLESNVVFGTIILDAAEKSGCKNIINTGSYWQNFEKENYNPVNLYAATKQAMEDILLYYVKARECRAITLQIFDTYGPDDPRNKILNIIRKMENGARIEMSFGEQKLYYCYIDDVISGYMHAIEVLSEMGYGEYERYVLRDKEPVRLRDTVELYLEIHEKKLDITWGARAYRDREIMDPTGIGERSPGWNPVYSLEQGLEKL